MQRVLAGVERPGSEVGHSATATCSATVHNDDWRYTSTPICLHGVDRNNFTFYWIIRNTLSVQDMCTYHCAVKGDVQVVIRYVDLYLL
jgi:hypothetical protein